MMASIAQRVIVVTGGARAGKSQYAEQRAEELGGRRVYVATAEPKDEEMTRRIAEHRKRRGDRWITVEEPMEVPAALLGQRGRADSAVVDCVTLWLSNLLLHDAEFAEKKVEELLQTLPRLDFHLALVTNEVGSGIVPDNALARRFRDLAGSANQRIAAAASEVILMVAGVPVIVKRSAS